MFQEFFARLQQESKTTALKINFRVGTLQIKHGHAQFVQSVTSQGSAGDG